MASKLNSLQEILPPNGEPQQNPQWRYDCELGSQHIDAAILPRISARHPVKEFDEWAKYAESADDKLGYLARWVKAAIHQMPAGIDVSRDVDGGGYTKDRIKPTMFTGWVPLDESTHVRFSEARTAMHNTMTTTTGSSFGGALRSPVMRGVALEATSAPDSLDPRDALTLAVYEYAREEDARYPWLKPFPGRLFDLSQFSTAPYTVGPLYNGHPNRVENPADIDKAVNTAVSVLRLTVEANVNH